MCWGSVCIRKESNSEKQDINKTFVISHGNSKWDCGSKSLLHSAAY